jgi:hypothetical protein
MSRPRCVSCRGPIEDDWALQHYRNDRWVHPATGANDPACEEDARDDYGDDWVLTEIERDEAPIDDWY